MLYVVFCPTSQSKLRPAFSFMGGRNWRPISRRTRHSSWLQAASGRGGSRTPLLRRVLFLPKTTQWSRFLFCPSTVSWMTISVRFYFSDVDGFLFSSIFSLALWLKYIADYVFHVSTVNSRVGNSEHTVKQSQQDSLVNSINRWLIFFIWNDECFDVVVSLPRCHCDVWRCGVDATGAWMIAQPRLSRQRQQLVGARRSIATSLSSSVYFFPLLLDIFLFSFCYSQMQIPIHHYLSARPNVLQIPSHPFNRHRDGQLHSMKTNDFITKEG